MQTKNAKKDSLIKNISSPLLLNNFLQIFTESPLSNLKRLNAGFFLFLVNKIFIKKKTFFCFSFNLKFLFFNMFYIATLKVF